MIVAVKAKDRVVVATSTCDGSINMSVSDIIHEENVPFWKVQGVKNCYVCANELTAAANLLRYTPSVFRGITDCASIMQNVMPKMKQLFEEHGQLLSDRQWSSDLVIIKDNKVFLITKHFDVREIDDYVATNHERYINGALSVIDEEDPKARILQAIQHTCSKRNCQLFPLVMFDTKSKKSKAILQAPQHN